MTDLWVLVADSSEEAQRFAREIAGELGTAHRKRKYGRLIIMAAPAFLGILRGALGKGVADTVVAEVPKNLVTHAVADVEAHIP